MQVWNNRSGYGFVAWIAILLCMTLLGCTSVEYQQQNFSRTALGSQVEYDQAWKHAQDVMRAEFGSIRVDAEESVIESRPDYYRGEELSLSQQQHLRRRGRMELVKRHGQWWAFVEVVHERLDTQTYDQFQHQRSDKDHMLATPMETGENRSVAQRQIWSAVRREKDVERRILEQLRAAMGLSRPD